MLDIFEQSVAIMQHKMLTICIFLFSGLEISSYSEFLFPKRNGPVHKVKSILYVSNLDVLLPRHNKSTSKLLQLTERKLLLQNIFNVCILIKPSPPPPSIMNRVNLRNIWGWWLIAFSPLSFSLFCHLFIDWIDSKSANNC